MKKRRDSSRRFFFMTFFAVSPEISGVWLAVAC